MPDKALANSEPLPHIRRLMRDSEMLREGGIVEIACENASVADYIKHWEVRALAAEAEIKRWQALDEYLPIGFAIGDDATAELAVQLVEVEEKLRDALKKIETLEK